MLIYTIASVLVIAIGAAWCWKQRGEKTLTVFLLATFALYFFVATWWLFGITDAIILMGMLIIIPPVGVMLLVGVVASIILAIAA